MSAPDDGEERSVDSREAIELRVEYERLNAFFADYTKNISRGSTFIQTRRPLPPGTEFVFQLLVPTLEQPIAIRGQVQSIVEPGHADTDPDAGPPGMRIRFVYATDEERSHVERVVERLMVDSLGPLVYRKLMEHGRGDGGARDD